MNTIDVRLLVRGDARRTTAEVLEQLLSGALVVHAVVELATEHVPPSPPVHRSHRSETHYAAARDWRGEAVRPPQRPGVEPGSSAEVYP